MTHGLSLLRSVYPTSREEFLLAALERHEYNAAATLGWLVSVQEVDTITAVMKEAFPGAPLKTVTNLVQDCGGDVSVVWSTLSQSYDTSWTDKCSSSALQRVMSHSNILIHDDDSDVSEVLAASPALKKFENEWWSSLQISRRFHLGHNSPHSSSWDPICSIACTAFPISPRFVGYITALGRRRCDISSFKEAVTFIRSMPQFMTISAALSSAWQSATPIVKILLEDGLANPSAALWLALNDLGDNGSLFSHFAQAHKSVCRARNKALHTAQLVPHESATTADAIVLDTDVESDLDTEIIPDPPTRFGGKLPSGKTSERRSTRWASDRFSAGSAKSTNTLDSFLRPDYAASSLAPTREKVARSRAGASKPKAPPHKPKKPVKPKKVPTVASTPFRDS